MKISIRNLKPEDLNKAAEIFYKSFNSVGQKWNQETTLKRLEQCINLESCWVAEADSKIVGFIISKIDNVLDHQELYIDLIAVEPKYHKLGIGKKLLETAEDYAKNHNLKAMWLSANSGLPSFNWYIKTGFKETKWKALTKELK